MGTRTNRSMRLAGLALLVAMAAACGGGSDGDGVAVPPPPASPPAGPPAPPPSPPPPPPNPPSIPDVLAWGTFPASVVVLGQQGFAQGDAPADPHQLDRLDSPTGNLALMPDGRLFVSSAGGIRMFRDYAAVATGATAGFELGVSSLGLSSQGQMLVRVSASRVLIYNTAPADDQAEPDVILGDGADCAADAFNSPRAAIITPRGQLVVADTANNRVLIWDAIPAPGVVPKVIGQHDTTVCSANDSDGNGTTDTDPSNQTLNGPSSVWSDGHKLVVVDQGNNRVLIWDDFPNADFQAATRVIGQASFTFGAANGGNGLVPSNATLFQPESVDVRDSGQLAVSDAGNNRVLIWDRFPTAVTGEGANQVIGQSGFDTRAANAGGTTEANTLSDPSGVRFDGRNLLVVDRGNHRVLVFRATN